MEFYLKFEFLSVDWWARWEKGKWENENKIKITNIVFEKFNF